MTARHLVLLVASLLLIPAHAGYEEGRMAYDRSDYATALEELLPLALQGHALAQYYLGRMYDLGLGVQENKKEAVKWYLRAAMQGVADAQLNLGVRYQEGRGVQQDDKEALKWFTRSAEQGNAKAQYHLGAIYEKGESVPRDLVLAYMLYNLAAASGLDQAVDSRTRVSWQMSRQQIEEAQRLSRTWQPGQPLPTSSLSERR